METLQNDTENVKNSTNNKESAYKLLQENKGFITYMAIIFVFGVIGNAVIIRVYWKKQKRHATASKSFIKTLAVTDLLLCVLIIPYSIIYEMHLIHNSVLCRLFEFIRHFMIAQALLTMVGVAIERYFAICHPLKHFSRLLGRVIITGCTLLSFFTALPILFIYELHYIHGQAHCEIMLEQTRHGYGVFLTIGFLSLIVTTIVLYGLVYKVVLQRALYWRKKVHPIETQRKRKSEDDRMKPSCISLPNIIENTTSPTSLDCLIKTNSQTENIGDRDKTKTAASNIDTEKLYTAQTSSYNGPLSTQNSGHIQCTTPNVRKALPPIISNSKTAASSEKIKRMRMLSCPVTLGVSSDITQSTTIKQTTNKVGQYSRFQQPPPIQRKKSLWIEEVAILPPTPQTPNSDTCPQDTSIPSPNRTQKNWLTRPHHTTASMLFGVTIVFILSWIPFWLIKFQVLNHSNSLNYTFLVNNASNAIVYFICNKRVRNDMLQCILCKL